MPASRWSARSPRRRPATIRTGEPVFLIDIDIDRFKQINDSIGYSQGDELIRAFAERLQRQPAAKGVVIGRIGAGEFAVLLSGRRRLQSRWTGSSRS